MSIIVMLGIPMIIFGGVMASSLGVPIVPPKGLTPAVQAHLERVASLQLGAALLGVFGAVVMAQVGTLGRGLLLAGPIGGLIFLLAVIAIEFTVSSPRADSRTASVVARRVTDYLPKSLTIVVGLATFLLVALSAAAAVVGSADDLGRPGRSLTFTCGEFVRSRGPWPGTYYVVPALLAVGVGLVAVVVSLRLLVARARVEGAGKSQDDFTRRHTAMSIVGAYGVMVSVPLGGMGAFAANASLGLGDCFAGVTRWLFLLPLSAGLFALFVFGWCCVGFGKNLPMLRGLDGRG